MEQTTPKALNELCIKNGAFLSPAEAVLPVANTELEYGFGVYETLRVENNILYFAQQHIDRLLFSAAHIGLDHPFSKNDFIAALEQLNTVGRSIASTFNIKILLLGGSTSEEASYYLFASNPLFVNRTLYKTGCHTITAQAERPFPQAKTLAMLKSYVAFREAKRVGAYDALLINTRGEVTEGTRTNLFAVKDRTIIHPPQAEILEGVTKQILLSLAQEAGFSVVMQPIPLASLMQYDGAFLTSTSTKVLPIRSVNDQQFANIPDTIRELMQLYKATWKTCNGIFLKE